MFIALAGLIPRLTVTNSGVADDKNPLSAFFTVSNDGIFPLFSVEAHCMTGNKLTLGDTASFTGDLVWLGGLKWGKRVLWPGDKIIVPISNCVNIPNDRIDTVHLGLRVTYRPIPYWTRIKISDYTAHAIGNGHFSWYGQTE